MKYRLYRFTGPPKGQGEALSAVNHRPGGVSMKEGRAALGRTTPPHFIVILSRLPGIGDLNPVGGHLDASLLDRVADLLGNCALRAWFRRASSVRGLERSIHVFARGIARGGAGQLQTGDLNRDKFNRGVTENVQSQSVINFAPLQSQGTGVQAPTQRGWNGLAAQSGGY